ncbi:hypothetical protein JCM17960_10710 [Magnetospira thiophila]
MTLADQLERATGADRALDRALRDHFLGPQEGDPPPLTGSVDRCLELVHQVLPGWHWHVGWGASGFLPYALLSHQGHEYHSDGPTVPLALLRALMLAWEATTE